MQGSANTWGVYRAKVARQTIQNWNQQSQAFVGVDKIFKHYTWQTASDRSEEMSKSKWVYVWRRGFYDNDNSTATNLEITMALTIGVQPENKSSFTDRFVQTKAAAPGNNATMTMTRTVLKRESMYRHNKPKCPNACFFQK